MNPRVFISYSWSSPGHQSRIREWAELLVSDGIDIVFDMWNLKEGDDKYVFMEKMVTDTSITHVLVFSDSQYAAKADAREAGVGTESQIISREVYQKVQQSKFIPVACEFNDAGEPFFPNFLKSRIWINFSTPEAANENWERLIRLLYGKPAHEKPTLGKPPSYITTDTSVPTNPAGSKFAVLRQAMIQEKRGLKLYRQDFLDACYSYADALRIRKGLDSENIGQRVLEDCGKLKQVRNHIVDWILLESSFDPSKEFGEALIATLEQLLELKSRPPEVSAWNDNWFEAHSVFVYETFLYIVAALIKTNSYALLNLIFSNHYLLPETEAHGAGRFGTFDAFYGESETLQILASKDQKFYAPAAELVKRQADRNDLPFSEIIQADLLVLMMASIMKDVRWYPQTQYYSSHSRTLRFFLRAAQHRHFLSLAQITGIDNADKLREVVKTGLQRLGVGQHRGLRMDFWSSMNMDALDTVE